jgi:hypothetical protein
MFYEEAINKMMEIAGYKITYLDLQRNEKLAKEGDVDWYQFYTMTTDQQEEWKQWFLTRYRKVFKANSKVALNDYEWFNLSWGLKIKDEDDIRDSDRGEHGESEQDQDAD